MNCCNIFHKYFVKIKVHENKNDPSERILTQCALPPPLWSVFRSFCGLLTGTKKPREQKGIILSLEMEINYCICTVVNDYKRRGVEKYRQEQKGIFLSLEMEINYCICTVVNDYKRRGVKKSRLLFMTKTCTFTRIEN